MEKKRAYTRDEIDAVKAKNLIEDVVARYVPLKRRGRSLVGLCPFHQETEPSFYVTPARERWHCFGACGEGGDVIDFIMRIIGDSFLEAMERLGANRLPPPVPIPKSWRGLGMKESRELTREDRRLIKAVAILYHTAFNINPRAKEYVTERGISLLIAQRQMMGYARGDRLVPYLKYKGFSTDRALDLGLLCLWRGKPQEFFRNRVTIAETDRRGNVIHLIGRALDPKVKPKYLTAPGMPKPVYGMARLNPEEKQPAELVEGPFDFLTLLEWGRQGLAAMGTHLSDQDAWRLARVEKGVNITPDADDAGWSAARDWALAISDGNDEASVRLRVLPEGIKDINDLARAPGGRALFPKLPLLTLDEATGMGEFDPRRPVIVVRSRFDWLLLRKWDYPAVCVLGRSISPEMGEALAAAPVVHVAPENTDVGRQVCRDWPAAIGGRVEVVSLPDGIETIRALCVAQVDGGRSALCAWLQKCGV